MTWQTYNAYDFANLRHIGPSRPEVAQMLAEVGVSSLDELIEQTIPAHLRQRDPLSWEPVTEGTMLDRLRTVASRNQVRTSLIGQGFYGTVTPPAIQRNVLENP
ncbi:MAG: glycine dehydrogenase (aminomethyl-transferring), partial [Propionibacteriaceae bacterium]|nr:glycine dehydrogenase (aminomethyl-transferring) [Propionibacteriaceae bacterium]